MNAKICDRCGKIITRTYYEISITAHDVNVTALNASETFAHNLSTSVDEAFKGKKSYCKECIDSIQKAMQKEES